MSWWRPPQGSRVSQNRDDERRHQEQRQFQCWLPLPTLPWHESEKAENAYSEGDPGPGIGKPILNLTDAVNEAKETNPEQQDAPDIELDLRLVRGWAGHEPGNQDDTYYRSAQAAMLPGVASWLPAVQTMPSNFGGKSIAHLAFVLWSRSLEPEGQHKREQRHYS
jgi:hypothetical protein